MTTLLRLGHADGQTTIVGFHFEPDHDDLQVLRDADPTKLNSDPNDLAGKSLRNYHWLRSLPEEHQPYWTHINQVDDLWPGYSDQPPAWVSCPDHPLLEQALAEHFTARGHVCTILAPEPAPEAEGEVS